MKPIKVRIQFTVEIDPAAWAEAFGTAPGADTAADIRDSLPRLAEERVTAYLDVNGFRPEPIDS